VRAEWYISKAFVELEDFGIGLEKFKFMVFDITRATQEKWFVVSWRLGFDI
jgi:hypothetical protein